MYRGKFEGQSSSSGSWVKGILVVLVLLLVVCGVVYFVGPFDQNEDPSLSSNPPVTTATTTEMSEPTWQEASTQQASEDTTASTEPYVVSTASIGMTGDILMHTPILASARTSDGEYDFNDNYTYIRDYFSSYDLMIANLEVTLRGPEVEYVGYPVFNCPDTVIDALQNAGVDMMLTANNHTYDTGYDGLIRTQEVLNEKGMPYIGTRQSESDPFYMVKDVNGIKIGMACYTYETEKTSDGRKTLNGIPLTAEACPLVNSFHYDYLGSFYRDVEDTLTDMKADGAQVTMIFVHWGNEYQTTPNHYQEEMAQQLCELGVDVIIGGHPHVLQPLQTLTSTSGHETICLYSMGNAVSNQRRDRISSSPNGNTEDGLIFELEFELWNNGSVKMSEIDILPTWVKMVHNNGERDYTIIPLDAAIETWDQFGVDAGSVYESYERTMDIVGEGLNACRASLGLDAVPVSLSE